ncbi:glycosyltransferase family 4 protein [Inconstantimicrobium mannanitabidum]|uniref:Glycosyl transferase family 1 n=1 Tax=Inconstantimicrobium mannanitabidum TaxID=1604901 RepID=A0ACB5REC3_9CLOT|nr:glycosyltransferase family 4 protein [Clostridium sp. TW13]GKX67461.1 glycosyl transferase family 1 [Clostridium sp. TW13]
MKILFVAHEMELGGATLALLELIDNLKEIKVDICVLLHNNNGSLVDELQKRNIEIVVCKSHRLLKHKFTILNCIKILIAIAHNFILSFFLSFRLKKMNISCIHSNSSVVCFGAFLSHSTNIPHIQHIREVTECSGRKYIFMRKWILKFIQKNTFQAIAVSNSLKESYTELYKDKISTIYDGIKLLNIRRFKLLSEDKKFNICVIGAICESKGQIDAINSVDILIRKGILNIKLFIIGGKEENYYSKLISIIQQKGISEYIEFIDFNKDINKIRYDMNLELNCSRSEGFGRTTVEAMMYGIPIIGADNTATLELIGENMNGILYKTGDSYDLANKIEYVINNQEHVEKIATNAHRFAEENFTDKINSENIYELYAKVIEDHCK